MRLVLCVLFRIAQLVFCNAILGFATALKLMWPGAEYLRWLVLGCVATRKLEAGTNEKAKRFASELLTLSGNYKDDWNYGNAIHKGNLILGRVALRAENLEASKQYLLCAGETPGSPQLNSFGPNMSLAKELLEAGEKEAVLEYFNLCANFWEMDSGMLKFWEETVRSGHIPHFGRQLLY